MSPASTRRHEGGAPMALEPEEPAAGPWRAVELDVLVAGLLGTAPSTASPRVVAVDGRAGSGKSTLAGRIADAIPRSAVVHTDDLAWHEPLFGWDRLLLDLVRAARADGRVRFRPPQWDARARPGAIEVPAGTDVLVVEGCGAGIATRAGLADATVWVQADLDEAERRGIARDLAQGENGTPEEAAAFWQMWAAAERPFFARVRTWDVADMIVAGTPVLPLEPGQLAVAPGHGSARPY